MEWWLEVGSLKVIEWFKINKLSILIIFAAIILAVVVPICLLSYSLNNLKSVGGFEEEIRFFAFFGWLLPTVIHTASYISRRNRIAKILLVKTATKAFAPNTAKAIELKKNLKTYQQILGRCALILFFVFALALLLIFFMAAHINQDGFDTLAILLTSIFVPVVALAIVYVLMLPESRLPQLGLICPACGEPLIGPAVQVAITAGSCSSCGKQIS